MSDFEIVSTNAMRSGLVSRLFPGAPFVRVSGVWRRAQDVIALAYDPAQNAYSATFGKERIALACPALSAAAVADHVVELGHCGPILRTAGTDRLTFTVSHTAGVEKDGLAWRFTGIEQGQAGFRFDLWRSLLGDRLSVEGNLLTVDLRDYPQAQVNLDPEIAYSGGERCLSTVWAGAERESSTASLQRITSYTTSPYYRRLAFRWDTSAYPSVGYYVSAAAITHQMADYGASQSWSTVNLYTLTAGRADINDARTYGDIYAEFGSANAIAHGQTGQDTALRSLSVLAALRCSAKEDFAFALQADAAGGALLAANYIRFYSSIEEEGETPLPYLTLTESLIPPPSGAPGPVVFARSRIGQRFAGPGRRTGGSPWP